MEIEEGILVDDWKQTIANIINIDQNRINFINYESQTFTITMNISESENDNIQDLYNLINEKYHIISLTYPYIYDFN